jgi:hypothetical protein
MAIKKRKKARRMCEAEFDSQYAGNAMLISGAELVPHLGVTEEAMVYAIGAEKHGKDDWRGGIAWSVCMTKIMRHLGRFLDGESRCPKDGQHHLGSVKFWCNTLIEFEQTHPELDDIRKG